MWTPELLTRRMQSYRLDGIDSDIGRINVSRVEKCMQAWSTNDRRNFQHQVSRICDFTTQAERSANLRRGDADDRAGREDDQPLPTILGSQVHGISLIVLIVME